MTCSVLPTRDSQPHSQPARRWPRSVRPAGLTVTLCPGTCSLTEMVTVTSNRSVMAEPTHLGSHAPNCPLGSGHVVRRDRLDYGRARAGEARHARRCAPARPVLQGRRETEAQQSTSERRPNQQEATQFCGILLQAGPNRPRQRAKLGCIAHPQPNQDHAWSSRFAWRSPVVQTPNLSGRSQIAPGGKRRAATNAVVLALVGLLSLVLVSRAGAATPSEASGSADPPPLGPLACTTPPAPAE
jgi:hypothetical protein